MIDFHTHILPEIDDGSSSVKESVVLLKRLKEQGVSDVFLTPHFYAYSSSAENYEEVRDKSLRLLVEELNKDNVDINLYLGSEVYFFEELWRIENIKLLCIKGTDYILLEMPFASWTDSMVRSIEKLIGRGVTPILAHFERYIGYKGNLDKIYELINMGVLLQMNCNYINKFITRRKAVKFIKRGMVSLLGTDCHNLIDRSPDFSDALARVKKKLRADEYKRFVRLQKRIISAAKMVYPV